MPDRLDLLGVGAGNPDATRAGWETARAAVQGGAMLTGLKATDRCDRCGARAEVLRLFAAGELLFCAHHARAFGLLDPPTVPTTTTPQSEPLRSE